MRKQAGEYNAVLLL